MVGATDYDTIASRYAAGVDERPWNALYERPATLALLPDVSGKDILDAGCGSGWYADWLARSGARVVAVDCSSRMVVLADERLDGHARVMQGDVSNLGNLLLSETFDVVLSSLVLHYLADLTRHSRNGRASSGQMERWCFQLITRFTKLAFLILGISARG